MYICKIKLKVMEYLIEGKKYHLSYSELKEKYLLFSNLSLVKYILSPQEKREAEEKHLAELKERLELAQKEFNKALDEYGK